MFGVLMRLCVALAVSICCLQYAAAEYPTAVKPLAGYVCMGLKTDKEYNDWVPGSMPPKPGQRGFADFPVFQIGTEHSRQLGYQSSPVLVAWPEDEVDGFVRIIRINGERAWIHKDVLVPFGTALAKNGQVVKLKRTCMPLVMSNGSIGLHFGGSRERE